MPIPSPATAARRLAGLLVKRESLTPPIPIRDILSRYADIEAAEWPHKKTDAVIVGLGHPRPRVFYLPIENDRRLRFTLAHELAHILIYWHLGSADCSPGDGSLDLDRYGQEEQADIFASCLLLPDQWLLAKLRECHGEMTAIVQSLGEAQVTTKAALLALRRVLLAGWVFVAYRGEYVVASVGTKLPQEQTEESFAASCTASGRARLNGFDVKWFRMAPVADLPPIDSDVRSTTTLLQDAVALHVAGDIERVSLMQRTNGRVGGVLREAAGRPAFETYSTLEYRMLHSEDSHLLDEPEFRMWLARKARDIETGNTKRAQRRR